MHSTCLTEILQVIDSKGFFPDPCAVPARCLRGACAHAGPPGGPPGRAKRFASGSRAAPLPRSQRNFLTVPTFPQGQPSVPTSPEKLPLPLTTPKKCLNIRHMNYKTCASCQESLPETCFYKDDSRKDGKRPYCKACQADRQQRWRLKTGRTRQPRVGDPYKMCGD